MKKIFLGIFFFLIILSVNAKQNTIIIIAVAEWKFEIAKGASTSLKLKSILIDGVYFLNLKTSTQNFNVKLIHQ